MINQMNSITRKKYRILDTFIKCMICLVALLVGLLVVGIITYVLFRGFPAISWEFLSTKPSALRKTIGILPGIINTVYMVIVSLLFSLPIGIGGAIYLNEYAKPGKLVKLIEFTTETLSGIPSIIFGVFGWTVFCLLLDLKVSIISGALTLSIMVLPTIVRTTQEALKSVPSTYREGALAIGATKWHIIRTILLPSAMPGIVTAVILCTGRIVGESAAILLTAGVGKELPEANIFSHIFSSGGTLTVQLYDYASNLGKNDVAFAIATVLILIVLILNISTRLTVHYLTKKNKQ